MKHFSIVDLEWVKNNMWGLTAQSSERERESTDIFSVNSECYKCLVQMGDLSKGSY